ncbi:hypothetical protein BH11PSE3_BH11PSE3_18260 [soil metagenome]
MQTVHLHETARVAPDESPRGAFVSDLSDLFVAILVVLPVAWLLKALIS